MISYKVMLPSQITNNCLNGFQRFQETKRVKYVKDNKLLEKCDSFVESWNQEKLNSICEFMKSEHVRTIFAKEKGNVVGFAVIDVRLFDGYINMPYIHVDQRNRKQGIGMNLLNHVCSLALENKASKLYISGHPAVETQLFYESMGCVLAEKINKELYDLEPLDIQLEKSLSWDTHILNIIKYKFAKAKKLDSVTVTKISNQILSFMPKDNNQYLDVCLNLLKSDDRAYFSMGTLLIKKNRAIVTQEYIESYETTLYDDIHDWDQVDQYCYRVLGPIFNNDYMLFPYLLKWAHSSNKDVRRASLVSTLNSSKEITCTYPIENVFELIDVLINDQDFHVKKAIGWVLKCCYVTYPNQIEKFLIKNVKILDRVIFRYALEHMDQKTKNKFMSL